MKQALEQALQQVREALEARPDVLALHVFGSYTIGDVWEQSDLDLFIIVDGDDPERQEAAMLTVDGVTVHVQTLTRASLIAKARKGPVGRPFHTALASGRFLFCRDPEVRAVVEALAEVPKADRALRAMCEVSQSASNLYYARKHLRFGRIDEARLAFGLAARHWVRARLFAAGVLPNRFAFAQARALGMEVPAAHPAPDALPGAIEALHRAMEARIAGDAAPLLDCLREAGQPLSEVELEERFADLPDTDFGRLLELLQAQGLVRAERRPYLLDGQPLGDELVYRPARP